MISFKSNQNVQPLFDYYLETDLDNFDDQPVDYSKKYADVDSYEDCRLTKSVLKTNEFPAEVSQTIKQSCNDEVKVYCIEGTPLTISSASSFCDLREVGSANAGEKSDTKPSFSSVNGSGSPESFEVDFKKDIESSCDKKEEMSSPKEKEGKSVSFRNSNDISKASSPLMFSRSSSIASLNSFEQQSIVDDRSSVSVFSALTSGLISPSDLPDSPGEVMSPALTDKASSPKIDVTKIDCHTECHTIGFSEKDKVDPEEIGNNDRNDQISDHAQSLKAKEYIPVDSYKSSRNSEDDILVERLEVSNDSLDIDEVDEVFVNPDYEKSSFSLKNEDLGKTISKSDEDSDGEDDILLQQCIKLGMPNNSVEKSDMIVLNEIDYPSPTQNVPTSKDEIDKEVGLLIEDIDRKDDVLKLNQVQLSEDVIAIDANISGDELKTLDVIKSVEDSDEDDELLQRCIQLGMPESTSKRTMESAEGFVKIQYLPNSSTGFNSENDLYSPPCPKSDDSDGDDILLQQCIQLGMPKKSSGDKASRKTYKGVENENILKNNIAQVQATDQSKSNELLHCDRNIIPSSCMQFRMPAKLNKNGANAKSAGIVKYPCPVIKNTSKNVPTKMYPTKTYANSDRNETGLLLQHCVQRGVHKDSCERKRLDREVFRKSEYNSHPVDYHSTNRLKIAKECGDKAAERRAHNNLGNTNIVLKEFEVAAVHYKRTLQLAIELRDRVLEADAYYSLGNTYALLHDYPSAIDYYLRHLRLVQELKDKIGEGRAYWSLVKIHSAIGNHEQALLYANKHLEISKEIADQSGKLTAQHSISNIQKTLESQESACCSPCNNAPISSSRRMRHVSMEQMNLLKLSPKTKATKSSEEKEKRISSHVTEASRAQPVEEAESGLNVAAVVKKNNTPSVLRRNDLRDNCPDGISDGEEEDDLLAKCIRAGMPSSVVTNSIQTRFYASQVGSNSRKLQIPNHPMMSDNNIDLNKKFCHPRLPQNQPYAPIHSSTTWLSSTSFIDVDSMRIYQTEDTPILSPTASISDLSSLSFNESFLNNSRNSDCSSESDDDELLLHCIRSGMPEARRAVA